MITRTATDSFVTFKINSNAIRKAVKEQCSDPIIALSKNDAVLYSIADMMIRLVNKYVPMKSGNLRSTAHIVQHAHSTKIVYGDYDVDRTAIYALYQYERERFHPEWKYTTPGTTGDWMDKLKPNNIEYQQLTEYATNLMRKAVKK